jgi:hypothetical protein
MHGAASIGLARWATGKKRKIERAAFAGLAIHDPSAMADDNAVHDGRTEPSASADSLGREEWFEYPCLRRSVHSTAGPRDGKEPRFTSALT